MRIFNMDKHSDTEPGYGNLEKPQQIHLTLKTVVLFFFPLIFMTELVQISHSIVHAFLSRLPNPKETLAAFSIAFAFVITINGITVINTQAGISFIKDRVSFFRILRFFGIVSIFPIAIIELVALTSLGNVMFGEWMGASSIVVSQAKAASAILGLWIPPILIRNFAYALAMIHRRTILITYATIVRLSSLCGFLFVLSYWLSDATVGATATLLGMIVETIYMVIVTWPYFNRLEKDTGNRDCYIDMWRFSWPLMLIQVTENGGIFIINFFLGRLSNPDLALAAFGVVYGLVRVIMMPLRNLGQTAQTLVHRRGDLPVIFKFSTWLLFIYLGLLFITFYTPMRMIVLESWIGLTIELSRYCTPALKLTYLLAIFWASSALFRGLLSAIRRTGPIAATAGIRLVVVTAISAVTFFLPDINGAVVGVLAMGGAYISETIVLGWRFWRHYKVPGQIFLPHMVTVRYPAIH